MFTPVEMVRAATHYFLWGGYRRASYWELMRESYGFTLHPETGDLVMALVKKRQIPDIKELFNADGTLSHDSVLSNGMHALSQLVAGHAVISNGKASQTDLGNNKKHISIEFDRQD